MSAASTEFVGVINSFVDGGRERPPMSVPLKVEASKDFIDRVRTEIPCTVTDDEATAVADYVLNLMEKYGAFQAQPVVNMHGTGPCCSWCGTIWPLCGHHHWSGVDFDNEEAEDEGA